MLDLKPSQILSIVPVGASLGVADGPLVHVAAASCAGFTAASLSAPADALMTQCRREEKHLGGSSGPMTCKW